MTAERQRNASKNVAKLFGGKKHKYEALTKLKDEMDEQERNMLREKEEKVVEQERLAEVEAAVKAAFADAEKLDLELLEAKNDEVEERGKRKVEHVNLI